MSEKEPLSPQSAQPSAPLVERRRTPRPFENKTTQVVEKATDSAWALFEDVDASLSVPTPGRPGDAKPDAHQQPPNDAEASAAIESMIINMGGSETGAPAQTGGKEPIIKTPQVEEALAEIRRQHPQIANKIDLDWGHKTCTAYIQSLLSDSYSRDQNVRSGFSTPVARALMNLLSLHP